MAGQVDLEFFSRLRTGFGALIDHLNGAVDAEGTDGEQSVAEGGNHFDFSHTIGFEVVAGWRV
jgi:hypothetical protein